MGSQLLYLRGSGSERGDIVGALTKIGYGVRSIGTIEETVREIAQSKPAMLIVDASSGEQEASGRIVELANTEPLKEVPVLFLSYQAGRRTAILKKQYMKFLSLDVPFTLSDLIAAISEVAPPASPAGAIEPDYDLNPLSATLADAGKALFEYHQREAFSDKLLIPDHPKRDRIQAYLKELDNSQPWLGAQARKISFLSSILARSIGVVADEIITLRVAGIMLPWGLQGISTIAKSYDYLLPFQNHEKYIAEIISGYKLSSTAAASELKDLEASLLIDQIVNALEEPRTAKLSPAAGCLLITDIASRAAWCHGQLDAHGAYRTVRHVRRGSPVAIPEDVIAQALILLSDGMAAQTELFHPIELLDGNPDYEQALSALRESELTFQQRTLSQYVLLSELQPGMILGRPLISWDGRLVFPSGLRLNDDLLTRLLVVSTVRPFRKPISIVRGS
jgi:hypothetical protein